MNEKISTNIRVLGFIFSQMDIGKTEFSIIERETIDGINFYKGLLDNGTVCPVTKENGDYIAYDTDCKFVQNDRSFDCATCIITNPDELEQMTDFANWIIEKRKKEQQGN